LGNLLVLNFYFLEIFHAFSFSLKFSFPVFFFLRSILTDALHWEGARIIETWSYRWASEVFHEFSKQVTGFESARVQQGGSGYSPLSFELCEGVNHFV
jgi:hypothetical protein